MLFFSTSTATNASVAALPLDTGSTLSGSGIRLSGPTEITISNAGFYLVSYYFQGTSQASDEILAASLYLNGRMVTGSLIESNGATNGPVVSNTVLINIGTAPSTIWLINASNGTVSHIPTQPNATIASVTITRVL